jgi:hypothetical protein
MRASDNVHAPGSVGLGLCCRRRQWPCSSHMARAFPWPWAAQLADKWFTDLRTEGSRRYAATRGAPARGV